MDYNFNDIDKYIMNGGDPEELAKAFTDKLNAALNKSKYNEALVSLTDAWNTYVDARFSKKAERDKYYVNTKEMEELFGSIVDLNKFMEQDLPEIAQTFFKNIGV